MPSVARGKLKPLGSGDALGSTAMNIHENMFPPQAGLSGLLGLLLEMSRTMHNQMIHALWDGLKGEISPQLLLILQPQRSKKRSLELFWKDDHLGRRC